jgi:hypothetical protein
MRGRTTIVTPLTLARQTLDDAVLAPLPQLGKLGESGKLEIVKVSVRRLAWWPRAISAAVKRIEQELINLDGTVPRQSEIIRSYLTYSVDEQNRVSVVDIHRRIHHNLQINAVPNVFAKFKACRWIIVDTECGGTVLVVHLKMFGTPVSHHIRQVDQPLRSTGPATGGTSSAAQTVQLATPSKLKIPVELHVKAQRGRGHRPSPGRASGQTGRAFERRRVSGAEDLSVRSRLRYAISMKSVPVASARFEIFAKEGSVRVLLRADDDHDHDHDQRRECQHDHFRLHHHPHHVALVM